MPSSAATILLSSLAALTPFAFTQAQQLDDLGSWPHIYPGLPTTGTYGPEWQSYFQVIEALPGVTWSLPRNWAGNIPVQRAGHPNNTLFFWAFESLNGSFTANNSEPWGIWLNGGPGASSLLGLFFENGPIHIQSDRSVVENQYAWTNVADYVWIDQPVGTGYSTADPNGLVADEDQLGADFMGFLENFIKVFPNLAERPLYITGESYAGTYIPYIMKAYFEMDDPPIHLAGIAIGDGTMASMETAIELPVVSVLETYPQIIGYDTEVFEYFREQSALCGYDITLQYPQSSPLPTLGGSFSTPGGKLNSKLTREGFLRDAQDRIAAKLVERDGVRLEPAERVHARSVWKRDLAGRANGTIDPWYRCALYDEMVDYAINFTFPWSSGHDFDPYNIPDALSPEALMDASFFLNDAQTRAAIHSPTSKIWSETVPFPFAPTDGPVNSYGYPSVEPMSFLTDLATNATAHGVSIVIYSGNDDSLVPHFGSQVTIQNTTFSGIQGFTRKPATPWYNDAGQFGGIVHQERGWKYVLVDHAGHLLGYTNPISALTLVREFIFGSNQTGLVTNASSGTVSVVGGEASSLEGEIMTGQAAIYYGYGTTVSSYAFPSATVEAWESYIATATATSRASAITSWSSTTNSIINSVGGSALVVVLTMLF